MIPLPKRIHWDAHTGDLYVRCDDERGVWEEHADHVDEITLMGLPDRLTAVSYWGNLDKTHRGTFRVLADREIEMSQEQCEIVHSWLLAARRAACNLLGIED